MFRRQQSTSSEPYSNPYNPEEYYQQGYNTGVQEGMDEMPLHPITLAAQDPNVIKWQLQIKEYLARLQHFLLGHVYNPIDDTWSEEETNPTVNKAGMQSILSFVSNELDKTLTLSNLNEESVLRMAREARRTITEMIYLKWQNWNLTKEDSKPDIANAIKLVVEIDHIIYSNLRRAFLEGERRYHKAIQSYKEIVSSQRNPKQMQQQEFWK